MPIQRYDVDGAIITHCPVDFIGSSFPTNGTIIVNAGTAGLDYNGSATSNRYTTGPGGGTGWDFLDTTERIATITGLPINNFTTASWEIGFYINSLPSSGQSMLFTKLNGNDMGFWVNLDLNGLLYIRKDQTSGYAAYNSSTDIFAAGHYYLLQISWDVTDPTNYPIVHLSTDGAELQSVSLVDISEMKGQYEFVNDDEFGIQIDNRVGSSNATLYTLYYFRWHDRILTQAEFNTNYNASIWRLRGGVAITTTTLGASTTNVAGTTITKPSIDVSVPTLSTLGVTTQTVQAQAVGDRYLSFVEELAELIEPVDTSIVVAYVTADEIITLITDEVLELEVVVNEDTDLTPDEEYVADSEVWENILHPAAILEIITLTTTEDYDVEEV